MPVDHGVPDLPGALVLGVVRADDVALELAVELLGDAGAQFFVDDGRAGDVRHADTASPAAMRRMAASVAATALR